MEIESNAGGVRFFGQAVLYLNAPRLHFDLDIRGGTIAVCEVQLNGAAGLMMTFESGMPTPDRRQHQRTALRPGRVLHPVTGLGVPFAVTVRQIFELKTVFTSTGALKARAYYTLKGGCGRGTVTANGVWAALRASVPW